MHVHQVWNFMYKMDIMRQDLWFWCVRPHLNQFYGIGQGWTRRVVLGTRRVGDHCAPNPFCEWVSVKKDDPCGFRRERDLEAVGLGEWYEQTRRVHKQSPNL